MEAYFRKSKAVVVHTALFLTSGTVTSLIECSLSLWKEDFYLEKKTYSFPPIDGWKSILFNGKGKWDRQFCTQSECWLDIVPGFCFRLKNSIQGRNAFYKMPPFLAKMIQTRKTRRLVLRIQNEYCSEHWFFSIIFFFWYLLLSFQLLSNVQFPQLSWLTPTF